MGWWSINLDMSKGPITINEAFKIRLEYFLREKNITLYKLCKESGVARSTITSILNGLAKSPTLATVYQVANGLDMTLIDFLDCDLFRDENVDF